MVDYWNSQITSLMLLNFTQSNDPIGIKRNIFFSAYKMISKQEKGQFTISDKNSTLSNTGQVNFRLPYQVNYSKIALETASFINPAPNSTFNISAELGNNKFNFGSISHAGYGSGITLTIPDNFYTAASLCAYISPLTINPASGY